MLSALVLSACPELACPELVEGPKGRRAEGRSLSGAEGLMLEIAGHISTSSMRAFRPFDWLRAGKLNDRPAMTEGKIFF